VARQISSTLQTDGRAGGQHTMAIAHSAHIG